MSRITKRVTRDHILHTDQSRDITSVASIDILLVVRLNLNQTPDTLFFAGARIVNLIAF